MLEQLNQGQEKLRSIEDVIPEIEKQIVEAEIVKQHVIIFQFNNLI